MGFNSVENVSCPANCTRNQPAGPRFPGGSVPRAGRYLGYAAVLGTGSGLALTEMALRTQGRTVPLRRALRGGRAGWSAQRPAALRLLSVGWFCVARRGTGQRPKDELLQGNPCVLIRVHLSGALVKDQPTMYAIVLKKKAEIIRGVVMGNVLICVPGRAAGSLSVAWVKRSVLVIST